jgi:DNA replication ATP-dependent helicase Dna2
MLNLLNDFINSKRVLFLDSDAVPAFETRTGDALKNDTEATLVRLIVNALLVCGVPTSSIGVISPYRTQLKIIRHNLVNSIEVHTVDKFQGRDKDCIIVSLVRSNAENNVISPSALFSNQITY